MKGRGVGWALLCAAGLVPVAAAGQALSEGPYLDPVAEQLHEAALRNREVFDDRVIEYTAVVRQRVGAALRLPLKDRTLYRMESAHRVFWTDEGTILSQVLALREQTPIGVAEGQTYQGMFDAPFDPTNDRLLFGFAEHDDDMGEAGDEEDFWFEHPLYPEYRDSYHFRSADTLTLHLPDGRTVQAIELQVVPVVADVHRMTGSLWIEPESGALARAVYRLSETFDAFRDIPDLEEEEDEDLKYVPGIFKPWTAEISLIAVDYALWDFGVWMPRTLRAEGVVTAGILKAPATIDVSYEMESVVTKESLEAADGPEDELVQEVHFRTRSEAMEYLAGLMAGPGVEYEMASGWSESDGRRFRYLVPEDPAYLAQSPDLPPPIWDDAPGFASQDELERLFEGLADLPTAPVQGLPRTFRWGLERPDLMRFNRVEGLSVGARGQVRPQTFLGPLSISATVRLGYADLRPNARLDFTRETIERRLTLSGYHELAAIDERARHLGLGNSLLAATIGRDDGDYYRRTGGSFEWTPPAAERQTVTFRAFGEYHDPVVADTRFALFELGDDAFAFRPNLAADEGWLYGGRLRISPWWGTDPDLAQFGLELEGEAATGDFEYGRALAQARVAVPLPEDFRIGVSVGGGRVWGSPPVQKLWYLGGPSSLRGYEPRATSGTSHARARGEVARAFSFGAVSVFTDLGWAGDWDDFTTDDGLWSLGTGLSILDGLIRFDAGWGMREPRTFRFDMYLDAIL